MDIDELQEFFAGVELPDQLQLDKATCVTNVPAFVESHLAVLQQNRGNPAFAGFLMRLQQAREVIISRSY